MKRFLHFGGGKIALLFLLILSIASNVYVCNKSGYYKHIFAQLHIQELKNEDAPDYWAVRGWTTCLEKMRTKCDICFFGHSQIEMSDFQKDFPQRKIIELGYPGDNLDGMIRRVNQIKAIHPDKVFLLAGTNSLRYKKDIFESKYSELVKLIREENPHSTLYIFSILPQCNGTLGKSANNGIIKERNNFIKSLCKKKGIRYIDIYNLYIDGNGKLTKEVTEDGLHLKRNCYDRISKFIKDYILK